jgi:hypothetical protein
MSKRSTGHRSAILFGLLAAGAAVAVVSVFAFRSTAGAHEPPELSAVALSPSRVLLSWSESSTREGTSYRVFRDGSPVTTTAKTLFTDARVRGGTRYHYRVAIVDDAGNVSTSSMPASVETPVQDVGPVYPLKVGPTRRYLVDQRNRPFMIVGDSPQAMTVNLSVADAEKFLANRRAAGFNTVWVNLLCAQYTGGREDGTTYDGIAPFRTPGDLDTPNEAFFSRVDAMMRTAAKYGIAVFLDPIETGGWMNVLRSNGLAKAYDYGRYIGARYRSFPNIIWFNGNDFQTWRRPADDALVLAVARGIKSVDPNHLQTVELNYEVSSSLDDDRWRPHIQVNAVYTYFATYAELLKQYFRPYFLPNFMVEANYEFEHWYSGPETLRRQEYWTMLSGAMGQLYGNKYTWQFLEGWENHLDTTGSKEMTYLVNLFSSLPWFRLVPDRNHTLVTAGYGTFAPTSRVDDTDYVTAARTSDGRLAMAYLPGIRTITVDLKKLAGKVRARWFDPTTGGYVPIAGSPFDNKRKVNFRPPGKNSDGDDDWILVLTA